MATPQTSPGDLEAQARAINEAVRNDPEGRYRLRTEFYRKYGGKAEGAFGFGNSEMAFLRWEIDRGALSRSPWWRAVNEEFNVLSTWAALIHESGGTDEGVPFPVRCWLEYIRTPGSVTWYRAHNTGILHGYLVHREQTLAESRGEVAFVNVVLYRVLFAQSLIERAGIGLGRWASQLAAPCDDSVALLVHLPRLYPASYPLSAEDQQRMRRLIHPCLWDEAVAAIIDGAGDAILKPISWVRGLVNAAAEIFIYVTARWLRDVEILGKLLESPLQFVLDRVLILPNLTELYFKASEWEEEPRLTKFLHKGWPRYPGLKRAV